MTPAASWSLILALLFASLMIRQAKRSLDIKREREFERRQYELHRRYGSHRRVS